MGTKNWYEVDRRTLLQMGVFGGAASILAGLGGCAGGGGGLSSTPGPRWDLEGLGPQAPKPKPTIAAAPQPASVDETVGAAPGVIPRSAWTSAPIITSRCSSMGGINKITIHHAAIDSSNLQSSDDVKRRLASIRNEHVNRKPEPFADIGYHFVIDPQGRVWEGRPLKFQGAHVADRNENNMGIMLLGDFTKQQPTTAQINSMDAFVAKQMQRYGIAVGKVYTHRELGKSACPGANLQRYMDRTRAAGGRLRNA